MKTLWKKIKSWFEEKPFETPVYNTPSPCFNKEQRITEYNLLFMSLRHAKEWHESGNKDMECKALYDLWRSLVDYRKTLDPVKESIPNDNDLG